MTTKTAPKAPEAPSAPEPVASDPFTFVEATEVPERARNGRVHTETMEDRLVSALAGQPEGRAAKLTIDASAVKSTINRLRLAAKRIDKTANADYDGNTGHLYVTLRAKIVRASKGTRVG